MPENEHAVQVDQLLYRVQRRDKLALKKLYESTSTKLLGIVVRIVKDQQESEDVLQEVFIKVWDQADRYSGTGSAWGWLCVLTRNAALDRLRKLKTHAYVSTDTDDSILERLHLGDEQLLDNHAIHHCLSCLKPQARQAILMSFVRGYSHNELATHLSAPLGTVKAWVRRGLQELKQCLSA